MIGRVISTKLKNTATILVERQAIHPMYKKSFIRSKRYLVDDPVGVKDGDMVEIIKIRPISKMKHWRIIKVLGKNLEEITEEKLKEAAKKVVAEVMPEEKKESESQEVTRSEDRQQGNAETQNGKRRGKISVSPKLSRLRGAKGGKSHGST